MNDNKYFNAKLLDGKRNRNHRVYDLSNLKITQPPLPKVTFPRHDDSIVSTLYSIEALSRINKGEE